MNKADQKSAGLVVFVLLVVAAGFLVYMSVGQVGLDDEGVGIDLGYRLNVNTASAAELQVLPGIGPTIAENIVSYREAHGAFESFEQLDDVSRIGAKTRAKFQPYIKLGENDTP
ncbi:ComEA family DNA-binding protein [Poriferisphaera sp. WC338]|uniref:ComEA family DNA-binding protein n=1 Tax=Poriferisphaera sp. WC338 TaxID=3425129 RepID=UPI003D81B16D